MDDIRIPYDRGSILFPEWFDSEQWEKEFEKEVFSSGQLITRFEVSGVGKVGFEIYLDGRFLSGFTYAGKDEGELAGRFSEQFRSDIGKSTESLAEMHQYVKSGELQNHVEFGRDLYPGVLFYDYFRLNKFYGQPDHEMNHPVEVLARLDDLPEELLRDEHKNLLDYIGGGKIRKTPNCFAFSGKDLPEALANAVETYRKADELRELRRILVRL